MSPGGSRAASKTSSAHDAIKHPKGDEDGGHEPTVLSTLPHVKLGP
jgi:hypothetical protein